MAQQFHFDPESYLELVRAEVPDYEGFQERLADATRGVDARRILDLGTGTGETLRRVRERHLDAQCVAFDESGPMLDTARAVLPDTEFVVGRLQDELPAGPFDLVVSAFAVHHLDAAEKADLFRRVADRLHPGGRVVLGDVVVPTDPCDAEIPIEAGYDKPDSVADQVEWLRAAGLVARVVWAERDQAIVAADRPA